MRYLRDFLTNAVIGGVLIVLPLYLAVLLLLKSIQTVAGLVRPIAALLPANIPAAGLLALVLVLLACAVVGVAARTRAGKVVRGRIEETVFGKLPGYGLFRSLTQQLTGRSEDSAWKPALAEIEDALVPAFIVEELDDGRYTIFVPSVPTPLAGAVYVLARERVHPIDVPFTQAVKAVSQWGSGAKDLVAAMQPRP